MTGPDHRPDQLDLVTDSIQNDRLDDEAVASATDRVWQRISDQFERPLNNCEDFQALIPSLLSGELPAARGLLVDDHTRSCVACRRAYLEARGGVSDASAMGVQRRRRVIPRWLRLAAAAVVALGLGLVGFWTVGNVVADRGLVASVGPATGELQLVETARTVQLEAGTTVRSRQLLRTPKNAGAELVLADGSVVEMASRTEVALSGAIRGTTVRLHRGNIIVRAAEQHGGRLYVATEDCTVAVKGTIFAVDHGFKGSRVSVIQGEVEVRQGGRSELLVPGQQITTGRRLQAVPIEEQIAWSPNAEQHAALLRELTSLQRDVVDAIEPRTTRTSTRLLDLAPGDTVIYAALPNLTEGLKDARKIVSDRLASSPALAAWWQENVTDNGVDREVDEVLDRLQVLGDAVGDEVVIVVPAAAFANNGGPLVLAVLEDPARFRAMIVDEIDRANAAAQRPVFAVVEGVESLSAIDAELLLWVHGDVFVAATRSDQLIAVADSFTEASAGTFAETDLHARLTEAYASGVSWIVGLDMASIMDRAAADSTEKDAAILARLGVMDATTLVVGYSRDGDERSIEAGLFFDGPRHGMAAWLSEPAPMGCLDFVSPQASLAVAAVTQDAAQIFDELLNAVAAADSEAMSELAEFERVLGIDLRADLAAPLGGEGVFAIDGPVLPLPSWKLVVEVYDPDTLQQTIERAVAEVSRQMQAAGRPCLTVGERTVGGRTYHVVRHDASDVEVAYLMVEGYLVMAPSPLLIDQALQYRASGITLPRSPAFRELLPEDGHMGCSALVWRNLGDLLDSLPPEALAQLPSEVALLLEEGAEPGLWCVYGARDRILASGLGGSLFTSVPLLGLSEFLGGHGTRTKTAHTPLSSAG